MRQETQARLIRHILAQHAAQSRDMAPAEAAVAVADYVSASRYEREVATIFRDYPLLVGHTSQVVRPGDFLTHDLSGVPLVLLRNREGRLNAFINLCRHRGSPVQTRASGSNCRALVCPYHGWTYDLDGRLIGIPDAEGFADIDRAERGLVAVPAVERHGLLWVRPTPGPAFDLDGFLGPIGDELSGYDIGNLKPYRPELIRSRINWKLMVDTFLETYHFKFAHSGSVAPLFLDNSLAFEHFGPHARMVTPKKTITALAGTAEAGWSLRQHSILLYLLFPNTVLVVTEDHVATFAMFPAGPEAAALQLTFYIPELPESDKAKAYWTANADMICTALGEDFAIGEGMQAGFHTAANRELVLGRYEICIDAFHREVAAALARNARP